MQSFRKWGAVFGIAVLCFGAGAGTSHAQTVRGTVYSETRTAVVPGVIVVFEDTIGVVTRALANERGVYALTVAAGAYRVHALRIGFLRTDLPPIMVGPTGVTTLDISMSAVPVRLPTVAVRSADVCRGQRSNGASVAAVWEEARKALIASELSTNQERVEAAWVEYERSLDVESRQVRSQRVRTTRTATTHAFRSASWNTLAAAGYVVDSDDGTEYHAPDAEVLLSESFASLHCFHLEPPSVERPTWIGVGFTPAHERRNVSEIEGTFWIDAASSELRLLEFQYTNLPPNVARINPGGSVHFQPLGTGAWLVNEWQIRMPRLVQVATTSLRRRGGTVTTSPTAVAAVRLVGGQVERVWRADSLVYQAHGAAFTIAVRPDDGVNAATMSVRDVRVVLDGTDYETYSDSGGRGRITPVLPGRYRYRVQSPLMDSLGVLGELVTVDIAANDTRVTSVRLPSISSMFRDVCGAGLVESKGAHVRGLVVDSSGLPVADAAVTVSWQESVDVSGDRMTWNDLSLTARTDSVGLWQVCGVPRNTGIGIAVVGAQVHASQSLRISGTTTFASSRIQLQPVMVADGSTIDELAASRGAVSAKAPPARVLIVVTDSAGHAIRDARVSVGSVNETIVRLRTDVAGRAVLARASAGALTVDVRKVGYTSGIVTVDIAPGENTVPLELLKATVPQLSAVRIVGDREVNTRHTAFERRRERGDANVSITAEEIERRNPVSTWQLLTRIPTVMVVDSAGELYAKSSRMAQDVCWLQIAVDGKIRAGRQNLVTLPPPSEIHGVEIFAGSARLPVEYHGGGGDLRYCGLIAIWTK